MAEEYYEEINPIFLELINGEQPVLVQFHATWCAPCKMLAPIVDAVSSNFENEIRLLKVDIDNNRPITAHLGIQSVPTLMIFKSGEILWHHAGIINPVELAHTIKSIL
jgi:thioredoxin 1